MVSQNASHHIFSVEYRNRGGRNLHNIVSNNNYSLQMSIRKTFNINKKLQYQPITIYLKYVKSYMVNIVLLKHIAYFAKILPIRFWKQIFIYRLYHI